MKKLFLSVLILASLCCIVIFSLWNFKATIAEKILSSHLGVNVKIATLDISHREISISQFVIESPRGSQNKTSLSAQEIDVQTDLFATFQSPKVIDSISISNLVIGLEYYEDGQTNWSVILNSQNIDQSTSDQTYLIKSLVLENITVIVTKPNGKVTQYPTIPNLTFNNINSAKTPIKAIEKAILKMILDDVMKKLNIFFNPQQNPVINPIKNVLGF